MRGPKVHLAFEGTISNGTIVISMNDVSREKRLSSIALKHGVETAWMPVNFFNEHILNSEIINWNQANMHLRSAIIRRW
jgi:hypothetical protein